MLQIHRKQCIQISMKSREKLGNKEICFCINFCLELLFLFALERIFQAASPKKGGALGPSYHPSIKPRNHFAVLPTLHEIEWPIQKKTYRCTGSHGHKRKTSQTIKRRVHFPEPWLYKVSKVVRCQWNCVLMLHYCTVKQRTIVALIPCSIISNFAVRT